MSKDKVFLQHLIQSKKNIKYKIMSIKCGVIKSKNYFQEILKPIIKPLNVTAEKINEIVVQNIDKGILT